MILETEGLDKEYLLTEYASTVWVSFWLNKASVFLLKGLFYVYEYFCTYVCVSYACIQKKLVVPLELELEMAVSHYVGIRNWTQILCKSNQCSDQPGYFPRSLCVTLWYHSLDAFFSLIEAVCISSEIHCIALLNLTKLSFNQ